MSMKKNGKTPEIQSHQSPCQRMIGVYNHVLTKVFRFHYHSQKVIGSLGKSASCSCWLICIDLRLFSNLMWPTVTVKYRQRQTANQKSRSNCIQTQPPTFLKPKKYKKIHVDHFVLTSKYVKITAPPAPFFSFGGLNPASRRLLFRLDRRSEISVRKTTAGQREACGILKKRSKKSLHPGKPHGWMAPKNGGRRKRWHPWNMTSFGILC